MGVMEGMEQLGFKKKKKKTRAGPRYEKGREKTRGDVRSGQ